MKLVKQPIKKMVAKDFYIYIWFNPSTPTNEVQLLLLRKVMIYQDIQFFHKDPPNVGSIYLHLDVSKNRGTPKWMVYNGKPYEQMDDLGVPLFLETPISTQSK